MLDDHVSKCFTLLVKIYNTSLKSASYLLLLFDNVRCQDIMDFRAFPGPKSK
jgi:hypothetical protein